MRFEKHGHKGKARSSAAALSALLFSLSLFLHLAFAAGYSASGDGGWLCTEQSQGHSPLSGQAEPAGDTQLGQIHCNLCASAQSPPLTAPLTITGFASAVADARGVPLAWVNPPDGHRSGEALARAPPEFS